MIVIPHRCLKPLLFDAPIFHAGVFGNDPSHLFEHFGGCLICPEGGPLAAELLFDAPGEITNDLPIRPRVTARFQRLAHALNTAIGVGERSFLFRPRGRGQENVGVGAGLINEQVLYRQELQLFDHVTRVIEIGLGHHWILAHDVERAHAARPDLAHDLRSCEPQLAVQRA